VANTLKESDEIELGGYPISAGVAVGRAYRLSAIMKALLDKKQKFVHSPLYPKGA
jgi:hypothetical protein